MRGGQASEAVDCERDASVDGALCDVHVGSSRGGSIIGTDTTLGKTGNAKVPAGTGHDLIRNRYFYGRGEPVVELILSCLERTI